MDALLVAEIGETAKTSTAVVMTRAQQPAMLLDPWRPTLEQQANKRDDVTLVDRGNSADYLTARIARDRPDILDRMKEGDFPSVRAAAKDAGLVKQRISISLEPSKAARTIRRHFDDAGVAARVNSLAGRL